MNGFYDFIQANKEPLAFVYGLAYFSAGLAILMQRRALSNFWLARNLWLVGVFFLLHGIARWGDIFIPIQSSYLSESGVATLHDLQRLLWASSYIFLLQFGVAMIVPVVPWMSRMKKYAQWYPFFCSAAFVAVGFALLPQDVRTSLIRYLIGFPATILAATAFLTEKRHISKLGSRKIDFNLTIAAFAFVAYGILGLVLIEDHPLPGMAWFNESVRDATGVSVHFWRMIIGVSIAVFIVRTLSVFDLEMRSRLEQAETDRAILEDRQRIARDLHDGVVQSIYAAGLQLEVASKSVQLDADEASLLIRRVVNQLNDVIADIRRYIFKLGSTHSEADFNQYMQNLIDEFTASGQITADLSVQGKPEALTPGQKQNIAFAARECLSNAIKHAEASNVQLKFVFDTDSLFFVVEDDGLGIDLQNIVPGKNGHGRGLRSMAERAEAMKGEFSISQRSVDGGTIVAMRIPYAGRKES